MAPRPRAHSAATAAAWLGAGLGVAYAAGRMLHGAVSSTPVRRAVTVNKPAADVERRWRELVAIDVDAVEFTDAPGDRGTEVHVELRSRRPGAAQKLWDELRRFKQIVETGDVVRSESGPRGESLAQHLLQRAARPVEHEDSR